MKKKRENWLGNWVKVLNKINKEQINQKLVWNKQHPPDKEFKVDGSYIGVWVKDDNIMFAYRNEGGHYNPCGLLAIPTEVNKFIKNLEKETKSGQSRNLPSSTHSTRRQGPDRTHPGGNIGRRTRTADQRMQKRNH